jgi:hypothetical protein
VLSRRLQVFRMFGSDNFSRHHTSPHVQGWRVEGERGELAAGDPPAIMSARARDRVAPAGHVLNGGADMVSIIQPSGSGTK